ncbi:Uncharacterised protein [Mycobacteroides abscessus subsp. abscessus]|nr:Uncharacterised protein [Mycobacteroides abscessus subsp. abscessus]
MRPVRYLNPVTAQCLTVWPPQRPRTRASDTIAIKRAAHHGQPNSKEISTAARTSNCEITMIWIGIVARRTCSGAAPLEVTFPPSLPP